MKIRYSMEISYSMAQKTQYASTDTYTLPMGVANRRIGRYRSRRRRNSPTSLKSDVICRSVYVCERRRPTVSHSE